MFYPLSVIEKTLVSTHVDLSSSILPYSSRNNETRISPHLQARLVELASPPQARHSPTPVPLSRDTIQNLQPVVRTS